MKDIDHPRALSVIAEVHTNWQKFGNSRLAMDRIGMVLELLYDHDMFDSVHSLELWIEAEMDSGKR